MLALLAATSSACGSSSADGSTTGAADSSVAPGLDMPRATIDFEERPEGPTTLEITLASAQEACVEAKLAQNIRVTPIVKSAAELVGPRRTVRAYYDGSKMGWYQTQINYHLNNDTCELEERRTRSVTVVVGREGRQLNTDHEGQVEVVDLPIEPSDVARAAPAVGATALRTVAGQPCASDSSKVAEPMPFVAEACFWQTHPEIRDNALQPVALYERIRDLASPDGPASVWVATSIRVGAAPPADAFALPSAEQPIPDKLFGSSGG